MDTILILYVVISYIVMASLTAGRLKNFGNNAQYYVEVYFFFIIAPISLPLTIGNLLSKIEDELEY